MERNMAGFRNKSEEEKLEWFVDLLSEAFTERIENDDLESAIPVLTRTNILVEKALNDEEYARYLLKAIKTVVRENGANDTGHWQGQNVFTVLGLLVAQRHGIESWPGCDLSTEERNKMVNHTVEKLILEDWAAHMETTKNKDESSDGVPDKSSNDEESKNIANVMFA